MNLQSTSLNFPVLVNQETQDGHRIFLARPLFMDYPSVRDPQYERALKLLQKEVRMQMKYLEFNRNTQDHLYWFKFNPDVTLVDQTVEFRFSRKTYKGQVTYVFFFLQGKTFVFFPYLQNYLHLAALEPVDRKQIEAQLEKILVDRLQYLKKNDRLEPGASGIPELLRKRKHFLTNVRLSLKMAPAPFSFEPKKTFQNFDPVAGDFQFSGSVEIYKVAQDLTDRYPGDLQRAFYREKERSKVYDLLFEGDNKPLALVGPAGVGKHSLLEDAYRVYLEKKLGAEVPEHRRLWLLDPNRVIAGMSYVGMWQKRFEAILEYLMRDLGRHPFSDTMLVDNPVALLRIGKSGQNNLTLSDVMKPYLEKRKLQVCLLCTPEQWKVLQEHNRSFSNFFQVIRIAEPPAGRALKMILAFRRWLEWRNNTAFTIQAINQLFTIQRSYYKGKALPGSVAKLMSQLAVKYKYSTVKAETVRKEFEFISGLRPHMFDPSIPLEKDHIKKNISRHLIGQPEAVTAISDALNVVKARLAEKDKPLASFLFIGPTGVGKTQAAKAISRYLTGDASHLLRFDMNEFVDGNAVSRLIGDYYRPEGLLTGKVRFQPFSVVLFDEIEKAHPAVHDLLLQLLDDGRLTDSQGNTTDFSNTIIIMTSNVGAVEASRQLGFDIRQEVEAQIYVKSVEKYFRPEFVNRIEKIVVFAPLQMTHIHRIARLQIQELLRRDGFVRRTTILNISGKALEWVAERGYNAKMGGRALKRQIEQDLTALSAEQLLQTDHRSPVILRIDLRDNRLAPHITPLETIDALAGSWLPPLPPPKKAGAFIGHLIRQLEKLEKELEASRPPKEKGDQVLVFDDHEKPEVDWQYYQVKERLAELRQKWQTTEMQLRDKKGLLQAGLPYRLKHLETFALSEGQTKEGTKTLLQDETLETMLGQYPGLSLSFDRLDTQLLKSYFEFGFLSALVLSPREQKPPGATLVVRPLILETGANQAAFLAKHYAAWLESQEIEYTDKSDPKTGLFQLEAPGIDRLTGGEAGLHLFFGHDKSLIPVEVRFTSDENQQVGRRIVRLYDRERGIADLRTNYATPYPFTTEELAFFLYAGLVHQNDIPAG